MRISRRPTPKAWSVSMTTNTHRPYTYTYTAMATKVQSSLRLVGATSSAKEPQPLSPVEREVVCAVLDDAVHQLAVLGGIMPDYASSAAAVEHVMGGELLEILEGQKRLNQQFIQLTSPVDRSSLRETARDMSTATEAARSTKSVADNMGKLQEDRDFIERVVREATAEVAERGTIASLSEALQQYWHNKEAMETEILEEEQCRKRVSQLKKEIQGVKRSEEKELCELNEQIAHLKDQLQELKAKTGLETKFTKKSTEATVEITQHRLDKGTSELKRRKEELEQNIKEEKAANQCILQYLDKHYDDLGTKLDHWMTKYEQETEMKSKDLQDLKHNKAQVLSSLQEMTEQYTEWEKVVVDHMAEKERQRLREEQEIRERQAAVKMQAWWRGMLVRKCLGPFAKKKKGKGKGKGKGKKGKKGKKKS